MTHKLTLPKAFGTNTIHGFLYEIVEKDGPRDGIMERMKLFLEAPIIFSLGFRNAKDLAFIAHETEGFVAWAKKTMDVEPQIMFV